MVDSTEAGYAWWRRGRKTKSVRLSNQQVVESCAVNLVGDSAVAVVVAAVAAAAVAVDISPSPLLRCGRVRCPRSNPLQNSYSLVRIPDLLFAE